MTDRTHRDPNARVRAIVDDAIAELMLVGIETRDAAAAGMAIQAIIRINDPAAMESVAAFAASMIPTD